MSYRQNEALLGSAQPPIEFVFRAVSKCAEMRNRLKKNVIKPTVTERKPDHTEISGFYCDEWPLGREHDCIPPAISERNGMLAFERTLAEDLGMECKDDEIGAPNHVCIKLPKYEDESGNTSTEYIVKRDELFSLLIILWTDCEPPVEIPA